MADWPYGYYQLLRVVVCAIAVWGATLAHRMENPGWIWLLAVLAVIFNPVFPVRLEREIWSIIDVGAAVVLVASLRLLTPVSRVPAAKPPGRPGVDPVGIYTREQWDKQYETLDKGAAPEPCPNPKCRRTGFYGPRGERDDPNTKPYRACKFCGFWQYEGKRWFFAIPTVHSCGNGRPILGAPQIWWEIPGNATFNCCWCEKEEGLEVEEWQGLGVEEWRMRTPREDPDHPFWQVPHGLSQEDYRRWWAKNEPWVLGKMPFGYF